MILDLEVTDGLDECKVREHNLLVYKFMIIEAIAKYTEELHRDGYLLVDVPEVEVNVTLIPREENV